VRRGGRVAEGHPVLVTHIIIVLELVRVRWEAGWESYRGSSCIGDTHYYCFRIGESEVGGGVGELLQRVILYW
jgi:hypothetical protein